jgi:cytochrome c oxidase cbb3-type subunit 3
VALRERDEVSGQLTTGHEWNGIKELNSPVPRAIWLSLLVLGGFALLWTALMPSWPTLSGYWSGLLGASQQQTLRQTLAEVEAERAVWTARLAAEDFATLAADEGVMGLVRGAGPVLFADNCAGCHGLNARGNRGYPNLVAAPMLWGDDPETVAQTIRAGINAGHADTRFAQMPAFGRDKMLTRPEIGRLVAYVSALAGGPALPEAEREEAEMLFADNCAGCHGFEGTGSTDAGAPDLTDPYWIYGGDAAAIRQTLEQGRDGTMPAWAGRLSEAQIRLLALYVGDLRSAAR